jgi:hypothetical protein
MPSDYVPVVAAIVYAHHPGRTRDLVIVEMCPWCGCAHRAIASVTGRRMRRRCPVTRRPYDLEPRVRRTVRRPAIVAVDGSSRGAAA